MWFHRTKKFAESANSKVHLSLWENLSSLVFGFKKNGFSFAQLGEQFSSIFNKKTVVLSLNNIGFNGLLISRLLGLILSNVYMLLRLKNKNVSIHNGFNKPEMKRLAYEYKSFPRINMLHAASDELKNSGLSFLILYFFMDRVLGIYNQTYRLLRAPLGIIGSAFGHVFFQEVAELSYSQKAILPLIQKTIKKLFLIGIPIFTLIFLFSPWFFTLFLGEKWTDVGVYAQYMTPWLFVNFIFSPVSHVALVVGKQFQFWMINLVSSSLVFISMILAGAVFKDLKIGLIVISTTQVIYSVCIYLWLQKIAEIHDQKCQQVD
jgi:O-antigen/teichoic acid export membrane protein